ncbi:MAG: NUDIX domain-containing protein [Patescibacteria group bacterium]
MKKLIQTQKDLYWIDGQNNTVELYLSDELPDLSLCTASYAFVFKDAKFLQTELREGERPERRLDIPGGHIDEGEHPRDTAVRETFEETGVHVKNPKLVGYIKITTHVPKPENSRYPYPTGFMLYYLCDFESEEVFEGNEDAHGRVWLPFDEFEKSVWCRENKVLLEEVIKQHMTDQIPQFGEPLKEYIDRPGVYAVIFNSNNEVLTVVTERGPYLPGGGVDPKESSIEALKREVFEETGFTLSNANELTRANQFAMHPIAGPVNKIATFYIGVIDSTIERYSIETRDNEASWMKVEDFLNSNTDEFHQYAVRKALENK